jgi:hypothetical protein
VIGEVHGDAALDPRGHPRLVIYLLKVARARASAKPVLRRQRQPAGDAFAGCRQHPVQRAEGVVRQGRDGGSPILLGAAKSVHILSPSATVRAHRQHDGAGLVAISLEDRRPGAEDPRSLALDDGRGLGLFPYHCGPPVDAFGLLEHFARRALRKRDIAAEMMARILVARAFHVAGFIDGDAGREQGQCPGPVATGQGCVKRVERFLRR